MDDWRGFYYDGRTAAREPVTVAVTADGLYITRENGATATWIYPELRRAAGVATRQVRFERGPDPPEAIQVDGTDILQVIAQVAPADARRMRSARRPGLPSGRAVRWASGGTAALAALYLWGVPAFARWVAPRVPAAWEEKMGRETVDRMAPASDRCTDPDQAAAIRSIVDRLAPAGAARAMRFTVTVADDSMVNAFAAPGGQIVVFTGLLQAAKSPEELAGVLAHEMQHAIHHHPTQALARELPLQIAIAAMSGGGDGLAGAARMAGALGALRYRRGDELQADRDGMRMIQDARIDPSGTVAFMRGLGRRHSGAPEIVSYLSTHPNNDDRVAMLEQLAAEANYAPEPLLTEAAWAHTQAVCRDETAP